MRWPPTASTCAGRADGQAADAGKAGSVAAVIDVSRIFPTIVSSCEARALLLGGRRERRPHSRTKAIA